MFPKTAPPQGARRLSDLLREQSSLPLWQAGPILAQLTAHAETSPCPVAPEDLLLEPDGQLILLLGRGTQAPETRDQPPEALLSAENQQQPAAQVYRLCALFCHLLTGAPPETGESLSRRRARFRMPARTLSLSDEAGALLFRLLDRGLRLEPTRRFPTPGALLEALDALAAQLDGEARRVLRIEGTAGVFAGIPLAPRFPAVLGRQPEACQILFPPDTPGVSRRHCKLELRWGSLLVTDLNASYGTFLSETRLVPWCPAEWRPGQILCLGSDRQAFRMLHKEGPRSGQISSSF